jgi:hypothetical protein
MKNLNLFQNVARGTDDDIVVVRAYIADNMEMSGGVLSDEAVWEFMKTLLDKPAEYDARIEGVPKHFSGIVFEELDKTVHLVDSFDVPISWSFYESLDPAEGKPVAWSFFVVSPDEFELTEHRTINMLYWIDYLKLEGKSISDMVRVVNQTRAKWGYKYPHWAVLDAKYGLQTRTTGENVTNWYNELRKHDAGVSYVLSNSKPGSIEVGEKIVKEYLKPKYHHLKEKMVPTLQMFRTLEHPYDTFNPITHMFCYAREEVNPTKRTEEYKDFVDTVRYLVEKYPRYWLKPEEESEAPKPKKYFTRR